MEIPLLYQTGRSVHLAGSCEPDKSRWSIAGPASKDAAPTMNQRLCDEPASYCCNDPPMNQRLFPALEDTDEVLQISRYAIIMKFARLPTLIARLTFPYFSGSVIITGLGLIYLWTLTLPVMDSFQSESSIVDNRSTNGNMFLDTMLLWSNEIQVIKILMVLASRGFATEYPMNVQKQTTLPLFVFVSLQ